MRPLRTLTICAWSALLAVPALASGTVVNRIVLRVNDEIVTLADYELRREERRQAILASELSPAQRREHLESTGQATMRTLFDEMLLLSRASQLGVRATEAEVDRAVRQTRERFGIADDEQFRGALAQQGMTLATYREQVRRNLLMDTVIGQEVRAQIDLDEQTLRRYYGEHRQQFVEAEARRLQEVVLLDSSDRPTVERERIAGQIAVEVAGGQRLADAVAPWTREGVATAVIDLGWVGRGDLDPALAEAAWALEPGEVSSPVPARGGLHVLQLIELREARQVPFEEVREAVRGRVGAERFQGELESYLQTLESRAYVVARVPDDAIGFRGFGQASAEGLTEAVVGTRPEGEDEVDAEVDADEFLELDAPDLPIETAPAPVSAPGDPPLPDEEPLPTPES